MHEKFDTYDARYDFFKQGPSQREDYSTRSASQPLCNPRLQLSNPSIFQFSIQHRYLSHLSYLSISS